VSKDVRIRSYFSKTKGVTNKKNLKTLIQKISHSMSNIGEGGDTVMLEPNMPIAFLFPSRSTDASFDRFRASFPNLKLLLDPTSTH
jgi:hypothetical protein